MKTKISFQTALDNMAYHVGTLMTEEAPSKGSFWIGDKGVEYVILPTRDGMQHPDRVDMSQPRVATNIWDQIWMRDAGTTEWRWCGNRPGGRDEYVKRMADALKALVVAG